MARQNRGRFDDPGLRYLGNGDNLGRLAIKIIGVSAFYLVCFFLAAVVMGVGGVSAL